jgi:hypothetical protein
MPDQFTYYREPLGNNVYKECELEGINGCLDMIEMSNFKRWC